MTLRNKVIIAPFEGQNQAVRCVPDRIRPLFMFILICAIVVETEPQAIRAVGEKAAPPTRGRGGRIKIGQSRFWQQREQSD